MPLLTFGGLSLAHKVVTSAWVEGDRIVGEVGFSNGEMAEQGTRVEAFGPDGARLGEAVVDGDGLFAFTPTAAVAHRFEVNLGAGHVGEVVLSAEELPIGLLSGDPAPTADAAATDAAAPGLVAGPAPLELESMIAQAVQRELRPLRRELAAYKEKNDLQGVLGGIGYICGIFGVLFFIYGRGRGPGRPGARSPARTADANR